MQVGSCGPATVSHEGNCLAPLDILAFLDKSPKQIEIEAHFVEVEKQKVKPSGWTDLWPTGGRSSSIWDPSQARASE